MCNELTEAQYALLDMAEQSCKWRALPERFGRWHTVYTRLNRWAHQGVLERVWAELVRQRLAEGEFPLAALDSTSITVNQQGTGAPKKGGPGDRALARRADHQAARPRARPLHPAGHLAHPGSVGRRA